MATVVGTMPSAARAEEGSGANLSAVAEGKEIRVTLNGKPVTTYKFATDQKYPYFYPVVGPTSGQSVTTETSQPYPHHHSLFLACDAVNGANYWQDVNERGQIVSQEAKVVTGNGPRIEISDTCLWKQPGKEAVMQDQRRFVICAGGGNLRFIDCYFTLTPLTDIHIRKTNHSLFAIRARPEIAPAGGGSLINSDGVKGEKATFGKEADWCGIWGNNGGVQEGIAILDHPKNRWYKCKWFTRDYGFLSPSPMNWLGEDGMKLAKGEELKLQYRVVVFVGSPEEAGVAKVFAEWAAKAAK